MRILKNSGPWISLKPESFPDEESNPTLSTARALKRAKEIIGDRDTKALSTPRKSGKGWRKLSPLRGGGIHRAVVPSYPLSQSIGNR